MKAVTCTNAKLEVVDLPTPTPAKGQLLIDVLRGGICGSDLHTRHHCDEAADVMAGADRSQERHRGPNVDGLSFRGNMTAPKVMSYAVSLSANVCAHADATA